MRTDTAVFKEKVIKNGFDRDVGPGILAIHLCDIKITVFALHLAS